MAFFIRWNELITIDSICQGERSACTLVQMASDSEAFGEKAVLAPPLIDRLPPHLYFVVSALFHYLGPSFAVLLFVRVPVLGVAWLRIVSAAVVFALWRRPWRTFRGANRDARRTLLAWGAVLAVMNCCFYESIDRLPLGTVA